MRTRRAGAVDDTLGLLCGGYAWLPSRWRRGGDAPVPLRLLGQRATVLRGPDAVRFFYDERHIRRRGAVPEPVQATLFGRGAVHTRDGAAHRHRKAMFTSLLADPRQVAALRARVAAAWDGAVAAAGAGPTTVFGLAGRALTEGVADWAAVPAPPDGTQALARDLLAMVDGFASLGPRHWRARRARGRREDWLAGLVRQTRAGGLGVPADSALAAVARHRDAEGRLLPPTLAAVELLNLLRPTVAVSWFAAFTAHALHRWPRHRDPLRAGDAAYAVAFAHEVRRFYPFAPFVGGRAVRDLTWRGQHLPAGSLVLLDLFGQDHDGGCWPRPYRFDPRRFLGRSPDPDALVPQGGGDPRTGHACPGQDVTVALTAGFATWLARLEYTVPPQDLAIPLGRIPTLPRSGFVVAGIRPRRAAPAGHRAPGATAWPASARGSPSR
ncbi:MAG TPA: cytochrome P450 [Pilimelia sp.]|nr:cytochrome P450 [Pilimelia sp.]